MAKQDKTQEKAVQHRQFEGVVVSAKTNKTISVEVETRKTHPKYQKQYTVSTKYAVHDEKGIAKEGDKVLFEECRPMSKTKRWRLLEVIK